MFGWFKTIGMIPRQTDCQTRSERDAIAEKTTQPHEEISTTSEAFPGYVATVSGRLFNVIDINPAAIDINEIAHALSQINRYCGHTRFPYSVAQHSVYCAMECEDRFPDSPDLAFACLMHDAAEAYCGDVIRPIKRLIRSVYGPIEARLQDAICKVFGIDQSVDTIEVIKQVDNAVAMTESAALMIGSEYWNWEGVTPSFIPISRKLPKESRDEFLAHFWRLKKTCEAGANGRRVAKEIIAGWSHR